MESKQPSSLPLPPRKIDWAIVISAIGAIAASVAAIAAAIAVWAQHDDQRELLQTNIAFQTIALFDKAEMRCARRAFAIDRLRHPGSTNITGWRVLDFFDTVGMYRRKQRIDDDSVYSSFSYYIERYWPLASPAIIAFRKEQGQDDYYDDFEDLYKWSVSNDASDLGKSANKVRPGAAELERFLHEEADLTVAPGACPERSTSSE